EVAPSRSLATLISSAKSSSLRSVVCSSTISAASWGPVLARSSSACAAGGSGGDQESDDRSVSVFSSKRFFLRFRFAMLRAPSRARAFMVLLRPENHEDFLDLWAMRGPWRERLATRWPHGGAAGGPRCLRYRAGGRYCRSIPRASAEPGA